jgi:hypothetical protein
MATRFYGGGASYLMKPVNQETAVRLKKVVLKKRGSHNETRGYGMNRNPLISVVPRDRFELPTRGFSVPCSTA